MLQPMYLDGLARLVGTGNMVLVHPMEESGSIFLPCCYGYATTIRRAQGAVCVSVCVCCVVLCVCVGVCVCLGCVWVIQVQTCIKAVFTWTRKKELDVATDMLLSAVLG